jgi:predicted esterase
MHIKLKSFVPGLVVGLVAGLVGACSDAPVDSSGSPPSNGFTSTDAAGDESDSDPEDDSSSDQGSSDSGSADEDTGTDGAETETGGPAPAGCLEGKVGVFNVNTQILYENDPDFVVHTYPSNSPDDAPASTADFFAKVESDPSVDENFLFASGFSYGATMSLIHGYMSSDKLAGIIHLSQHSNPSYFEDEFYSAERRIPVYIIHDDSYGAGGQVLRKYLLDAGYQDDVDLFYLDFKGGHSAPTPAEMETVLDWMKTMSLNGPCEEGG